MLETISTQQQDNIFSFEKIVIIGTGLMGTGIAQVAIESGINQVIVVGRSNDKCEEAKKKVLLGIQKSIKRKMINETTIEEQQKIINNLIKNLKFVTNLDDADLLNCNMVIEAVVENLKVKQKLFVDLETRVSEKCLLVTNTSSFLLEDVSCKMNENRLKYFGGLHFFNPVPAMKLVEVVKGNETLNEVNEALFRFCQKIGKNPVKCSDSPGFIVNRLLIPYLADSMRLAESGNATHKDIDAAMRLGTGHPMGPFELMDYIGLDTMKFIMDGWHQRCPDDHRYTPCEILERLVNSGKIGRKVGEGFYRYTATK
jgi:3-hydroxyacyl-CoA dehydrogenase